MDNDSGEPVAKKVRRELSEKDELLNTPQEKVIHEKQELEALQGKQATDISIDEKCQTTSGHKYKLTYLDGRGRAEVARLIFAAAGQKYEDVRIGWDKWPELKPKTPFGQIPILEIDGSKMLCQSVAIDQYLANELNLAGKTAFEKARAHMVIECCGDIVRAIATYFFESNEERKAELEKKYLEEQQSGFLAGLEKILRQNNDGDGFVVGDSLTWADLGLINMADWVKLAGEGEKLDKYEKLSAHRKRIAALPNVAEWLEKRPKTPW